MVNISTLFYRVDSFDKTDATSENPVYSDQDLADDFLSELLEPLVYDPGEELVRKVLARS